MSCNSYAIIDLPIFGLVSCTPIILLPIIGVQLTRTTGWHAIQVDWFRCFGSLGSILLEYSVLLSSHPCFSQRLNFQSLMLEALPKYLKNNLFHDIICLFHIHRLDLGLVPEFVYPLIATQALIWLLFLKS